MSFPVLICDDSAIARKMVQRSLPDDFASEIHLANNGQEALMHLEQNPVALLFLDLTMPVMDGLQVLQEIKQRCIEVFVIVISGDIQPEMKHRVSQLGALDFIEKPVDAPRLQQTLQRFGLY
ncbi:response regulator [Aestuariibacter halophilus]|uniref:Response regulator n=1 Tax=Fluctibacter halophilus TaxID=226011 RepID=A0ABS8GCM0_9ALTE|nr:response regulator [Aestuariibacter halophilus]MCC2618310.1 response regulator [Aestuariibacter halophilus]